MTQTTYNVTPAIGRGGMVADTSGKTLNSRLAEGDLTLGLLLQKGTADNQAKAIAVLPSAVADSIIETAVNSAATAQVFSGADFDGDVGADEIVPAQLLTFTLNNNADWDATTMTVWGKTPTSDLDFEVLDIPDSGNVTLTTTKVFSRVDFIELDAQSGIGGEMTAGTDPTKVGLDRRSFPGIAVFEPMVEPHLSTAEVEDEKEFPMMEEGRVWVVVEAAVSQGNQAWVRMVESGADLRGQFRGSYAAGFYPLPGAHFATSADADGYAQLQLDR